MVRTPYFHFRGPGFKPWSGSLRSHKPCGIAKKKKTRESGIITAFPYPNSKAGVKRAGQSPILKTLR